MRPPVMTQVAQTTYSRLGPSLTAPDEEHDWALAKLNSTLIDPLDDLHALHRDGWARIVNPATTPSAWLPWLAQIAGVELPSGTTDETARTMIAHPVGWLAGTPAALTTVVAATLTGTKTVKIEEHYQGDPWAVNVITYVDETPDEDGTYDAVLAGVEAGFRVTHLVESGWTFDDLAASGLTFSDIAKIPVDALSRIIPGTPATEIRKRYP